MLQGSATVAAGVGFGQDVRSAGGLLECTCSRTASGGSITAPDSGDPSVSAPSPAPGDTILVRTHRLNQVCYRDPLVLGGCSPRSTCDVLQGIDAGWNP